MTVTITGSVTDVTGSPNALPWRVWSPAYRQGSGGVVNVRRAKVSVTAGRFTAELEPGIAVIENPEGVQWTVTVPDTDADLWDLIEAAIAYPPDTPQELLNAAVGTYLATALPPAVAAAAPDAITSDLESREVQIVAGTTPGTVQWQAGDALGPEFPANAVLWDGVAGKPAVIATGTDQAAARAAIGAVDQAAVTAAVDAAIAGATIDGGTP